MKDIQVSEYEFELYDDVLKRKYFSIKILQESRELNLNDEDGTLNVKEIFLSLSDPSVHSLLPDL